MALIAQEDLMELEMVSRFHPMVAPCFAIENKSTPELQSVMGAVIDPALIS
ncbi:predicted protein [Sclerotinia sclerotiorum 1980 UF-70]|uniref:Uncharacterized protein n=1 Tax=Sclerotinia sclerotiorum (strain ATCC 18683 / 1980 / Ss-1) TaxID=665079 RepID=A7EG60_SCLS1|nr:predicted protein [Sclerotinia sclerotiorum 1980 UF-70]EDO01826.1 predicted protein [Sclerotinia sclerotiorum 1980 UF-70]